MSFLEMCAARERGWVKLETWQVRLCRPHWRTTSHTAAAVLARLAHWTLNGYEWIFKTDEDWDEEIAISADQAHTILKRMESLGWVDSRLAPRPGSTSRRSVTWYRLVPEALDEAMADLEVHRGSTVDLPEVHRGSTVDLPEVHRGSTVDLRSTPLTGNRDVTMNREHDARAREEDAADARFEALWQRYPRREGKQAARRSWHRLTGANRDRAERNLDNYLSSSAVLDGKAMYAERWLRLGHTAGFEDWDEPEKRPLARRGNSRPTARELLDSQPPPTAEQEEEARQAENHTRRLLGMPERPPEHLSRDGRTVLEATIQGEDR